MSRLALAVDQICFARNYTLERLANVKEEDWFRQPTDGVTHIAWQVGHLAMAEYRLTLERIRGKRPEDAHLVADAFLLLFGRGSTPDADPRIYPSSREIRAVFDRVHQRVLEELKSLPETELDQPLLSPHRLAKTKLASLLWCSQHEMLHAGQIGLLRRLLGYDPTW